MVNGTAVARGGAVRLGLRHALELGALGRRLGSGALRPGLITAALACAAVPTAGSAADSGWQPPQSIRQAAENYALAQVGKVGAAVEAISVDDRLKLPACSGPLGATAGTAFNNGRGTVIVSCDGPQSWRLYVPVRLSHNVPVVVVRQAAHRNQVLSAADLEIAERPAASVPYEYFTSIDDAAGTTLRRSLPAGAVLAPAAVDRATAIERGARVTLIAGSGPILVKAEGVALHRAAVNERVRVETAAGRVVEGRAEAVGVVRVGR